MLPDGCLDIIFNLGAQPHPEHGPGHGMAAFTVGAMTDPVTFRLAGRVDIIGVRFRPGGAAALFQLSARELTDRVVDLEDTWSRGDEVLDRLRHSEGMAQRLSVLEETLLESIGQAQTPPRIVTLASELIEAGGGRISVTELEGAVGISRRHLHRLFGDWVGLGPKVACRIARFQRAAARLRSAGDGGWARIAHECGYHDQAHLIRDFREFAGLTPGEYLDERSRGRFVQYASPSLTAD